nr:methyltransferase [Nonomuraea antri]
MRMSTAGSPAAELAALADLTVPMAIRTAAALRLADHVAGGADTAEALARASASDRDAVGRLMRHLIHAGVFARDGAGRYLLTALSECLRQAHPSAARLALDPGAALGRADLALVELPHAIRTGGPVYALRYGRPMWQDLADEVELAGSFDAFMAARIARSLPAIVAAHAWQELGSVLDAGGGNGALLIALLQAYPALTGVVLDQPGTVEAAAKNLAEAGLGERARAVAGDFFGPLPAGAGGYLLHDILHDWNDADAARILTRCAEAAGERGSVFVIERTELTERFDTAMDLRMLAWFGGRQRTLPRLGEVAATAGLAIADVRPAGRSSVVELRPYQQSCGTQQQHADQRHHEERVEGRRIEVGQVRPRLAGDGERAQVVERQHARGPGQAGDREPGQGDAQAAQQRGGGLVHGAFETTEE